MWVLKLLTERNSIIPSQSSHEYRSHSCFVTTVKSWMAQSGFQHRWCWALFSVPGISPLASPRFLSGGARCLWAPREHCWEIIRAFSLNVQCFTIFASALLVIMLLNRKEKFSANFFSDLSTFTCYCGVLCITIQKTLLRFILNMMKRTLNFLFCLLKNMYTYIVLSVWDYRIYHSGLELI